MRRNLGLWLGLAVLLTAGSARAIPIANADLIVILSNNGQEAIVNLGSFSSSHSVSLATAASAVGGLEGAKFVAIGVENPGRLTPDFGFGALPQENILFSSLGAPSGLTDGAIEGAMNITDSALAGTAWFWQLRSAPSSTFASSASFSYQNNLGLGTDAIANNFPFSIAGTITGGALSIGVYNAIRGYADFGGPATQLDLVGNVVVSGNSLNYVAAVVPEPGTLALFGSGLFGLALVSRRARRMR